MSVTSYDAVAEKILFDLESAIKRFPNMLELSDKIWVFALNSIRGCILSLFNLAKKISGVIHRKFRKALTSYMSVGVKHIIYLVITELTVAALFFLYNRLTLDEFYIIPTLEEDNKNSSPIIKGENTLGLESWIVTHLYPYAHHQILEKNNYKTQNLGKLIPCLTGVALLNPEMPTVWNRRRELILAKKLHVDNELRLTRMALSRKPKCHDALIHRKWIISEIIKNVQDKASLLTEELKLSEMIANRYHSNYHAWSHRMWSLQHLLPDSPFHVRKKSQKHCLFKTSVELSDVMNRSIGKSEFSYIKNCDISLIYFEELENNFNWVSSHVSDHSGLHFRKFLILEIFSFLKNYSGSSNKMEFQNEFDFSCTNSQSNLVSSVFANGRTNMEKFLGVFDYGNHSKKAVENYLTNLGEELTLFDLAMFLIVTELKSNYSLCLLFSNHEALWCYRRFLIFIYKQLIDALDYSKSNVENRLFLHLDRNGVPYKKDLKYDNAGESESITKRSDLCAAFYCRLVSNEKEVLFKLSPQDEHVRSLIKRYTNWLKHCLDTNEKFL